MKRIFYIIALSIVVSFAGMTYIRNNSENNTVEIKNTDEAQEELQDNNENLKDENAELEKEIENNESLTPVQQIFLKIDREGNWYDIEKILEQYPGICSIDVTSNELRKLDHPDYIQIGYEEDVIYRNIDIEKAADRNYMPKDGEVAYTHIDFNKEYIYITFSCGKIDDLRYCKENSMDYVCRYGNIDDVQERKEALKQFLDYNN